MNVLHINTLLQGGAAVAALKIHNDLSSEGVQSKFLYLIGNPELTLSRELYAFNPKHTEYNWPYLLSKVYHKGISTLYHLKGKHEIFSYPFSKYDVLRDELVQQADIVHLHWVTSFIHYPTFFAGIKKPVVWTLHDMNPFLGGFHYEDDQLFNRSFSLKRSDMAIKNEKERIFKDVDNITITAPSQWLLDNSQKSKVFSRFPHYHVPYSIDVDIFKMSDKAAIRQEMDIPEDQIVFTFLSDQLDNKRKGFEILLQSIRQLLAENKEKITILNVGKGSYDIACARNLGKITDRNKIAAILSVSDALLLPSREDNFPNVMLEANACGCPVIAFPVGGIQEFIQDFFNGLLTENVSAQSLKEAIALFIEKKDLFDREKIKAYVSEKYSSYNQATKYIKIYNSILQQKK